MKGFTLLEFLIAFTMIVVFITGVYLIQGNNAANSVRTNNMVTATILARNFIAKTDIDFKGKKFKELKEKETGNFPEPFKHFKWTRELEETDFSAISELIASSASGGDAGDSSVSEAQSIVTGVMEKFMKESVRKLTITVEWPAGKGTDSLFFSTFLVRYDSEISIGL